MLNWASQFSILLFLDNNNYQSGTDGYECLLAAGAQRFIGDQSCDPYAGFSDIDKSGNDWLFGHIAYDFKNIIEPGLLSRHPVKTGFPLFRFFVPLHVCHISKDKNWLTIETFNDPDLIFQAISGQDLNTIPAVLPVLQFQRVVDKDKYLHTIEQLRRHIADGDCYEINFCNEGYCVDAIIEPLAVFNALNDLSPAPFAAYYRLNNLYMMCASPERYLRKSGRKLLSQPIKGTARRDADPAADEQVKEHLRNDIKERAENVMIVDLVRNDLARCCAAGSVQVDELFGIYSFPQVHQMISTISGLMKPCAAITDAIRYSFPMGSMTGAPKYKVMQLIEQYEQSRRELFSGTVGYISPSGDFDFNVIIRSLFYNATSKYLSYQTGGAITYDSTPEQEWEEMRLKAWAMERIFSGENKQSNS